MASTKYANFIVDARGKIAGSLYQRNGGGSYSRSTFIPTNPSTKKQTTQRAAVKSIQSKWKSLSQDQRDAWSADAKNYPRPNRIGDVTTKTGHQHFLWINLNLRLAGAIPQIKLTPGRSHAFPLKSFAMTVSQNTGAAMVMTLASSFIFPIVPTTSVQLIIRATAGLTRGSRSPSKAKFKFMRLTAAGLNSHSFGTEYRAAFGSAPIGSVVFVRIDYLSFTNGSIMPGETISTIIT